MSRTFLPTSICPEVDGVSALSSQAAFSSLNLCLANNFNRRDIEPPCPSSTSSIFSGMSSPYGPATPTSLHNSVPLDGCATPPQRPGSSVSFDSPYTTMTMTPPPIMPDYMNVHSRGYFCEAVPVYPGTPPNRHAMTPMSTCPTPPATSNYYTFSSIQHGVGSYPATPTPYMSPASSYIQPAGSPAPSMWHDNVPENLFDSPPQMGYSMPPGLPLQRAELPAVRSTRMQTHSVRVSKHNRYGRRVPQMKALNGFEYPTESRNLNVCEVPSCGKSYQRPEHLKRHMKKHDESEKYECVICLKHGKRHVVDRLDNFVTHVAMHTRHNTSGSRVPWDPEGERFLEAMRAKQKSRRGQNKKGRGSYSPVDSTSSASSKIKYEP